MKKRRKGAGRPSHMPDKETIKRDFEVYKTEVALAKHYGVVRQTVARWLAKAYE